MPVTDRAARRSAFNRAASRAPSSSYIAAGDRAAATRRPAARSPPAPRRCSREDDRRRRRCCSPPPARPPSSCRALLLDLQPGDTVIVPSFTFTTTALAFVRAGRPAALLRHRAARRSGSTRRTSRAARRLGARRRASSTTPASPATSTGIREVLAGPARRGAHRGQRARPVRPLARAAARQPRPVRHARASTRPRTSSAARAARCSSTTPADVDRARVLYDKGTNRRAFFLGQVDKYSWKDTGSSFGLADVLAAYLFGQLEQRDVDPGQAPRASTSATPRCSRRTRRRLGLPLPTCRRTASRRTTCSTCCCPTGATRDAVLGGDAGGRRPADVPLRAAAQLRRRRRVRRAHDRVPGHRRHQRPAAAAAVLQQPDAGRGRAGRRQRSCRRSRAGAAAV